MFDQAVELHSTIKSVRLCLDEIPYGIDQYFICRDMFLNLVDRLHLVVDHLSDNERDCFMRDYGFNFDFFGVFDKRYY